MDNWIDSEWRESLDSPSPGRAPVCWLLIFLCIAVFVLSNVFNLLHGSRLAFSPTDGQVFPQLMLYVLVHADYAHLIPNLIGLLFLGTIVEHRYGAGRFIALFVLSATAAALVQVLFYHGSALIGASGAIAGVMAAFARNFIFSRLYFLRVVPMPAWLLIIIWVGLNIIGAGFGESGVAFVAHLGGFLCGWVLTYLLAEPAIDQPVAMRAGRSFYKSINS